MGRTADVALSERPNGTLSAPVDPATTIGRKSIFETYRFPLASYLAQEPDLDLARLAIVEFRFDATPTGRILVDDLEFVTRCADESTQPQDVGNRLRVDITDTGELLLDWSGVSCFRGRPLPCLSRAGNRRTTRRAGRGTRYLAMVDTGGGRHRVLRRSRGQPVRGDHERESRTDAAQRRDESGRLPRRPANAATNRLSATTPPVIDQENCPSPT